MLDILWVLKAQRQCQVWVDILWIGNCLGGILLWKMGDLNCFRSHCGGKMEFSYPSNTSLGLELYPCMKWHKRISQIYIPNKFTHIDFIGIAIFATMIIQYIRFVLENWPNNIFVKHDFLFYSEIHLNGLLIVGKVEYYYDNSIIKFKQLFWLRRWTEH